MKRRDIVAERLRELAAGFSTFVDAYDSQVPFDAKQLALHRSTMSLRQQAGSVAAAVGDPQFVASLRRTLASWKLDQRGSRLTGEPQFSLALNTALPDLIALEGFRIDAHDLPASVPEQLWSLIEDLGVTDNLAKIVAGTKTLHHLLPDLVPPMDRAWTGRFFGLKGPEWQRSEQKRTFLRLYRAFSEVAQQANPLRYVTGGGWRTSQTKILDNALIGYCKTELEGNRHSQVRRGPWISFWVPGYPPAKSETLSMMGPTHRHAPRVRALLNAAYEALQATPAFTPVIDGPVALDLILNPDSALDPWDATNYLGGVADVLEDKSQRGNAIDHLGDLALVYLYRNDRQIKQISYSEQPKTAAGYVVTVRVLTP